MTDFSYSLDPASWAQTFPPPSVAPQTPTQPQSQGFDWAGFGQGIGMLGEGVGKLAYAFRGEAPPPGYGSITQGYFDRQKAEQEMNFIRELMGGTGSAVPMKPAEDKGDEEEEEDDDTLKYYKLSSPFTEKFGNFDDNYMRDMGKAFSSENPIDLNYDFGNTRFAGDMFRDVFQ